MRTYGTTAVISCILLATSACSTSPRTFDATVSPPPSDPAKFQKDMSRCRALVDQGQKTNFASQAAPYGAGVATTVGVGAIAVSMFSGEGLVESSTAAQTLFWGAIPIGIVVGFGVSRVIRSKHERTQNASLSTCLAESNYTVVAWTPTR